MTNAKHTPSPVAVRLDTLRRALPDVMRVYAADGRCSPGGVVVVLGADAACDAARLCLPELKSADVAVVDRGRFLAALGSTLDAGVRAGVEGAPRGALFVVVVGAGGSTGGVLGVDMESGDVALCGRDGRPAVVFRDLPSS